jgi:hypothetical protein
MEITEQSKDIIGTIAGLIGLIIIPIWILFTLIQWLSSPNNPSLVDVLISQINFIISRKII